MLSRKDASAVSGGRNSERRASEINSTGKGRYMGWADERPQGVFRPPQDSLIFRAGRDPVGNRSLTGASHASGRETRVSFTAEQQRGLRSRGIVKQDSARRDSIGTTKNIETGVTSRSPGASRMRDVVSAKVTVAEGRGVGRDPLSGSMRGSASIVMRNDTSPRGQRAAGPTSNSSPLAASRMRDLGSASAKMNASGTREVGRYPSAPSGRESAFNRGQKDTFHRGQRGGQQDKIVNPSKLIVRERAVVGSVKHEPRQQRNLQESVKVRAARFGDALKSADNLSITQESGVIRGVQRVARSASRVYDERQRSDVSVGRYGVRAMKGDRGSQSVSVKTRGQSSGSGPVTATQREERPRIGRASYELANKAAIRRNTLIRQAIVDRLNRVVASASRIRRVGGSTHNVIQQLELASKILEVLGEEEDYGGISEILSRDGGGVGRNRRGTSGVRRKLKGVERAVKAKKDRDRRDKRGKKRSGETAAAGASGNPGAVTGSSGGAQSIAPSKIVSASRGGPSKSLDIFQAKSDDDKTEDPDNIND